MIEISSHRHPCQSRGLYGTCRAPGPPTAPPVSCRERTTGTSTRGTRQAIALRKFLWRSLLSASRMAIRRSSIGVTRRSLVLFSNHGKGLSESASSHVGPDGSWYRHDPQDLSSAIGISLTREARIECLKHDSRCLCFGTNLLFFSLIIISVNLVLL